jgi:hypothetical protein
VQMNEALIYVMYMCNYISPSINLHGLCTAPAHALLQHTVYNINPFITKFKSEECYLLGYNAVSCSAYASTLKMDMICSSEMSTDFQWTTWHYISEDSTLRNHCCESLKSHKFKSGHQDHSSGRFKSG